MLPLIEQATSQLILTIVLGILVWRLITRLYRFLTTQPVSQKSYIDRINRCLPQTQCGQCGYEGCRPYAKAIAAGEAINQCPPGGNETIIKLAQLTNEVPSKINPAHGKLSPIPIAFIREDECIGCTKCIVACPVDAIIGGPKLMHTVIESECTGCDLCVDPCPVDCIDMLVKPEKSGGNWAFPSRAGTLVDQLGVH